MTGFPGVVRERGGAFGISFNQEEKSFPNAPPLSQCFPAFCHSERSEESPSISTKYLIFLLPELSE
jgi:hypothetical protein